MANDLYGWQAEGEMLKQERKNAKFGSIVAVVGSRRRSDKDNVLALVDSFDKHITVVSGGCIGVDTWAIDRAKERGLKTRVFNPNLAGITSKADMLSRYFARNRLIAETADIVYAFVAEDRTGGTENTLYWAKRLGKTIIIK